MRLIDADALKKSWSMGDNCEDCPQDVRVCQYVQDFSRMDICEMLDEAPTVGGWISVEDRLPEECGRYLCWFGGNKCLVGAEIETYLPDLHGFGSLERNEVYLNITHWMPLPEPPKGDSQ